MKHKTEFKDKAKYQCLLCNFNTKYKHFLKIHIHVHESSKSVNCNVCGIVFPSRQSKIIWHYKNDLKAHVSTKLRQRKKPKRRVCSQKQNSSHIYSKYVAFKIGDSLKLDSKTDGGTNVSTNMGLHKDIVQNTDISFQDTPPASNKDDEASESFQDVKSEVGKACSSPHDKEFVDGNPDTKAAGNDGKGCIENQYDSIPNMKSDKDSASLKDENNNVGNSGNGDDENTYPDVNDSAKTIEFLICLICQTSFSERGLLIKHLVKVHSLTNLCKVCYFRDSVIVKFSNAVSLRNHRLRVHETEMKQCLCGTLFIDDKTLHSHQKKFRCDEAEIPKLQKCVCGKRFSTEKGLNTHKIFKCRKRNLVDPMSRVFSHMKRKNTETVEPRRLGIRIASRKRLHVSHSLHESKGKRKQKKKTIRPLADSSNFTEMANTGQGNYVGNAQIVDKNNNVMDSLNTECSLKCKENCRERTENLKPEVSNGKVKDTRATRCKMCTVKVKRCDIYTHQKIYHQRKTATVPVRKINSGMQSFR